MIFRQPLRLFLKGGSIMKQSVCAGVCALAVLLCGCGGAASAPETAPAETTAAVTTAPAVTTQPSAALLPGSFSDDGTFKHYTVNGTELSVAGVDVSSYSGDVDWQRVKDAGVTFVMVRLGGRGYGDSGGLYSDDRAVEYLEGAQAAGLHTGGYFFSQAITPEEAREEAAYCHQLLGDLTLDYPIAFDWEFIKDDDARTDNMTVAQTTACARAFCDAVKEYGWTPMLYAGDAEMTAKYDLAQLSDVEIWYTEYADVPNAPFPIGMWQYSKTAVIDGIEGNADLDMRFLPAP